ncbi:hypothetical protein RvY_02939-2 [Ramazzottius varieornatus]|uniref:Chromo domain-containing protein n=1 Tax=Ramazzottius varieornatus TaxID=947166 RepID=A0A1D1UQ62_RAMVA|nr:hypothetical protein RvY_02939-2 [Ramazzottius varieornatus]
MSDESFNLEYEAAGQSHIEEVQDDLEEKVGEGGENDEESAEPEYEVERILSRRLVGKRKTEEYLVRWKGYESEDDTWEPKESLDCPDLLKAFLKEQAEASDGEREEEEDEKTDDDVENAEEVPEGKYAVEGILDRRVLPKLGRRRSAVVEYQIKWKDYDETTWEPEKNLNCGQLLERFAKDHPDLMADLAVMVKNPARRSRASNGTIKKAAGSAKRTETANSRRSSRKAPYTNRNSTRTAQAARPRQRVLQRNSDARQEDDYKEASDAENVQEEDDNDEVKEQQGSDTDGDNEEPCEYEVEEVVGRRERGANRMVEYCLKWKNYRKTSWEKEENLTHCIDLLREYEKARKEKGIKNDDDNDGGGDEDDEGYSPPRSARRKVPARKQVGGRPPVKKRMATTPNKVAKGVPRKSVRRPAKKEAEEASGTLSEFLTDFRGQPLQKDNEAGPSTSKRTSRSAARSTSRGASQNTAKKRKTYDELGSAETSSAVYSKVLPVFLMKGSRVLSRRSWKFMPTDVDDWSFLDVKNFADEEEAVRVLGKGNFDGFDETFYIIVQGAAPNLYMGVTSRFLEREFPNTFKHHQEVGTFEDDDENDKDEGDHTQNSSDISME